MHHPGKILDSSKQSPRYAHQQLSPVPFGQKYRELKPGKVMVFSLIIYVI